MKGFQYRYYVRMREIEYTSYLVNPVTLAGGWYQDKKISAPRIDMTWDFKGYPVDEDGKPLPIPPLLMPLWLWRRILKLDKRPKLIPFWLWRRILKLDKKYKRAGEKGNRDYEKPKPGHDWRADEPERRAPQKIHRDLRRRWRWANVMLPHVLAVLLGVTLFILAVLKVPGFQPLHL
jgi:hypothetical protein